MRDVSFAPGGSEPTTHETLVSSKLATRAIRVGQAVAIRNAVQGVGELPHRIPRVQICAWLVLTGFRSVLVGAVVGEDV